MESNIINSLIFAGVIQGFIFGIGYFFSKKYKGKSTFYLAALILTFSYNNFQFFISNTGIMTGRRMYQTLYIPVGSLIPVFIYFYVLVFINPKKKITKRLKLLYLPFFIFLLFIITPYKIEALIDSNVKRYPIYKFLNGIQSGFSLLYTLALIIISYLTVRKREKSLRDNHKLWETHFSWLKNTLVILFFLSCFWAYALIKFFRVPDYKIYFDILWLGLSIAIYWLGHFGIYKYGIEKERHIIRATSRSHLKNGLSKKIKSDYISQLEVFVIEEKGYLNPNLTLKELADKMGISKSHLSRIINSELNMSFSDYVNSFRVNEAKHLLLNPEFSKYTLVSIGLESGFNSKTTFNNTFKKITGQTPSQFRKNPTN